MEAHSPLEVLAVYSLVDFLNKHHVTEIGDNHPIHHLKGLFTIIPRSVAENEKGEMIEYENNRIIRLHYNDWLWGVSYGENARISSLEAMFYPYVNGEDVTALDAKRVKKPKSGKMAAIYEIGYRPDGSIANIGSYPVYYDASHLPLEKIPAVFL